GLECFFGLRAPSHSVRDRFEICRPTKHRVSATYLSPIWLRACLTHSSTGTSADRATSALILKNEKRRRKTALSSKIMETCEQSSSELLERWSSGDSQAFDQLIPLVYAALRRMARRYMRQQHTGHTLQTTALIHEAYLRLVGQEEKQWKNRAHFFGVAAQAM